MFDGDYPACTSVEVVGHTSQKGGVLVPSEDPVVTVSAKQTPDFATVVTMVNRKTDLKFFCFLQADGTFAVLSVE